MNRTLLRDLPHDVKIDVIIAIDRHYTKVLKELKEFSYNDFWSVHGYEQSEINNSSVFFKRVSDYGYTVSAFAAAFGRAGLPTIKCYIIDACTQTHPMITRSKHVDMLESRVKELENVINEQNLKLGTMSRDITALEKTNTMLKEIINDIAKACC